MLSFNPIIETEDDGLPIKEVGSWAISKYNLVGRYCDVFTRSMKNKWENLIYIDLFAGSGLSKIKATNQIVYASPLIALSLPTKFTKYIFCEKDEKLFNALSKRVGVYEELDIELFHGDSNDLIDKIISRVPKFNKQNRGLSFGFVDPFSLNLNFNVIKKLSNTIRIDFLILLALHMDANRNFKSYFEEENSKIEIFLDDPDWREDLRGNPISNYEGFVRYLAKKYRINMESLQYQPTETFQQIRSDKKNLPLYYLAYFSRHSLGNKFWKEIQKYSSPQQNLF